MINYQKHVHKEDDNLLDDHEEQKIYLYEIMSNWEEFCSEITELKQQGQ